VSWSHVQGTGATLTSAGTTCSATLSGVTAGNMLVLGVTAQQASGTAPTVSVSDGTNSYSLAHDRATTYTGTSSVRLALYAAMAAAGSFTATVTSSASGLITLSFDEFAPPGTTPGLDASGDNADTATGDTQGDANLSLSASDLVIGIFDVTTTNQTYTAGPGFTLGYHQSGTNSRPYVSVYSLSAGPGSVDANVGWGLLNMKWSGVAAAWSSTTIATATPGWSSTLKPKALPLLSQFGKLY